MPHEFADFHDPAWMPRQEPPVDPDAAQVALHGDRLGAPRPCHTCGIPIRQAMERGRRALNLIRDVEGPFDPTTVPYPQVHAVWWHPRHGLHDRAGGTDARGRLLFVPHYHDPEPPAPSEGEHHVMTAPTFGTFVPPVFEEGDSYSAKDHVGANILLKVKEHKTGIITPNSPEGGPGVIVDLVDLGDGKLYRNVLFMGGAFVDGLKDHVGQAPVVITIVSKTGKSGRAYAAPEAGPLDLAQRYWQAQGDPFVPEFGSPTPEAAAPAPAAEAAPSGAAAPPWAK